MGSSAVFVPVLNDVDGSISDVVAISSVEAMAVSSVCC